ncbi:uncharacterized protein LOC106064542 isoform X1 [Biomphalaria glabrata]|uniref:Uncharacterized protein LOC106064542 isoform X1 n=1 Tax=Biomphalaria glabrata TaxID=6526 RepID=A0A9W3B6J3_BIOGL|nr:uncharacterized protein LOC106064542 isoform X1 [Biomphalaria glabrata]
MPTECTTLCFLFFSLTLLLQPMPTECTTLCFLFFSLTLLLQPMPTECTTLCFLFFSATLLLQPMPTECTTLCFLFFSLTLLLQPMPTECKTLCFLFFSLTLLLQPMPTECTTLCFLFFSLTLLLQPMPTKCTTLCFLFFSATLWLQPMPKECTTSGTLSHTISTQILALMTSMCITRPVQCPPTAVKHTLNNVTSCYTLHATPMTWAEAYDVCRREGSTSALISIETEVEQRFLVSQIIQDPALSVVGQNGFYTSGSDVGNEHSFKWTDTCIPQSLGQPVGTLVSLIT